MILVTGASGLIGAHLIQALQAQQLPVTALYRSKIPDIPGGENINWVQGDILDVSLLNELLQDKKYVYHCAATVSFRPQEKDNLYKTNVEGTANIVNACIENRVEKLLFVSSVAALGRAGKNIPVTEQMNWSDSDGGSEYGRSKYLAEMEVWRGIGEGLKAVIVNPVIVLGAGDWNTSSTALFKTAYNEFAWYTNGATGFVDVLDLVAVMQQLMASNMEAERFIVCGANMRYKAFFYSIATQFHKRPPHRFANPFLSQLVWRLEALRSFFTGSKPILTKETAHTAQAVYEYSTDKLQQALPNFVFTPIEKTIERICSELKLRYQLP